MFYDEDYDRDLADAIANIIARDGQLDYQTQQILNQRVRIWKHTLEVDAAVATQAGTEGPHLHVEARGPRRPLTATTYTTKEH